MNALEHFDDLFGEMELGKNDAARNVFMCGWNSACEEAMKRINAMPFPDDTRASFAVYFQQLMHIDIPEVKQ